jgi:protein-L-isoaspartate O-methyltransferase
MVLPIGDKEGQQLTVIEKAEDGTSPAPRSCR